VTVALDKACSKSEWVTQSSSWNWALNSRLEAAAAGNALANAPSATNTLRRRLRRIMLPSQKKARPGKPTPKPAVKQSRR
jgi:hypothetical protein